MGGLLTHNWLRLTFAWISYLHASAASSSLGRGRGSGLHRSTHHGDWLERGRSFYYRGRVQIGDRQPSIKTNPEPSPANSSKRTNRTVPSNGPGGPEPTPQTFARPQTATQAKNPTRLLFSRRPGPQSNTVGLAVPFPRPNFCGNTVSPGTPDPCFKFGSMPQIVPCSG